MPTPHADRCARTVAISYGGAKVQIPAQCARADPCGERGPGAGPDARSDVCESGMRSVLVIWLHHLRLYWPHQVKSLAESLAGMRLLPRPQVASG
jgi:hypothetical protein